MADLGVVVCCTSSLLAYAVVLLWASFLRDFPSRWIEITRVICRHEKNVESEVWLKRMQQKCCVSSVK
jgi:hypothetical protein